MRTLTPTEIREAYRVNAHAAAGEEQRELGDSQGRVNAAPGVRVLPRWLQQHRRAPESLLARTHGSSPDSEPA